MSITFSAILSTYDLSKKNICSAYLGRLPCMIFLALVFIFTLQGCQSVPKAPIQPVDISSPKEGEGLMYLFRPELDRTRKFDNPMLLIDGQLVASLGASTYTVISLKPGSHRLELLASKGDSSSWNTAQGFTSEAGKTYFVAIWNRDQPAASNITLPLRIGGAIAFIPLGIFGTSQKGVRLEPVDADIGASALVGLELVIARASSLSAEPK